MAKNIDSSATTTYDLNGMSADEKMWSNTSFDLSRLCSNIKLRGRRSRTFYIDLEKFYREYHAFYKVIIGDFNAKVGPRRTPEKLHIGTHGLQWNDWAARAERNQELTSELARLCREAIKENLEKRRAEVLAEVVEGGKTVRYARQDFTSRKTRITALRNPKGTTIASRRGMEKIVYDFYSDLFDSHVHLPPDYLREGRDVIPTFLEKRHAVMSVRSTARVLDRTKPEQLKNLLPVLINTLTRLFTRNLSEYKVPKQWKTSKTVLLYKKGDPHDSLETETVMEAFDKQCVQYIKVFRELYSNIITGIPPFYKNIIIDAKRGVRQDDTISPEIFTATRENAMRKLEWATWE
ncbi:hypothetical protein RB195_015333 [Necator americanus]|uniref:Endonuclease/exonuclease/phosphatase domain-containing protein n=1 Tax=Necator americanus TaxID=51031 RepID=A0ABR1E443_NECAM